MVLLRSVAVSVSGFQIWSQILRNASTARVCWVILPASDSNLRCIGILACGQGAFGMRCGTFGCLQRLPQVFCFG